jgi:hypothetical protein
MKIKNNQVLRHRGKLATPLVPTREQYIQSFLNLLLKLIYEYTNTALGN